MPLRFPPARAPRWAERPVRWVSVGGAGAVVTSEGLVGLGAALDGPGAAGLTPGFV